MTGSLQSKNGKYYVVVNLTDMNGKRKQKWIATNLTSKSGKKEREKVKREVLSQFDNNSKLFTSDVLFSDYVELWLKEIKIKVDAVTYQHYEAEARTHIIPFFRSAGVKLVDMDRQAIQNYVNFKFERGRLDGKGGLSATTLKHHRNVINQTLNLAVFNDLISKNPCCFHRSCAGYPRRRRKRLCKSDCSAVQKGGISNGRKNLYCSRARQIGKRRL